MEAQTNILELMEQGRSYTRAQLMDAALSATPSLKANTFQWQLGEMVKSGDIVRSGYNEYRAADGTCRPIFRPYYSDFACDVGRKLEEAYPYVQFTVFETVLMNEFLNHLIAQNTIFVQAEKDSAAFLFRFLQEEGYPNLMYKPTERERALYWKQDCIVVIDMVSEAPLSRELPHAITLEKMLVDMYCGKYVAKTFSASEYPEILKRAVGSYNLDRTRMLRYARRRNKAEELRELLNQIDR